MLYQKLLNLVKDFNKKEYNENNYNLTFHPIYSSGMASGEIRFQIHDGHFFLVFYDWNNNNSAFKEKDRFEFKLSNAMEERIHTYYCAENCTICKKEQKGE